MMNVPAAYQLVNEGRLGYGNSERVIPIVPKRIFN